MTKKLHVLAVEPYFGGSHRAFLESVIQHSRHRWTLVTAKSHHWKWRMRSAPLSMATQSVTAIENSAAADFVMCSDMLDISCWLGMLSRIKSPIVESILKAPLAVYFHENQWTYPKSPTARADHHFGYTNLLSAIAADACWFNSAFHRQEFLQASEDFVSRMPDSHGDHNLDAVSSKSDVIYPGFNLPAQSRVYSARVDQSFADPSRPDCPIRIGWVSRWEYDKRPDEFLRLLSLLKSTGSSCTKSSFIRDQNVSFELILLGDRRSSPQALAEIRNRFGDRIIADKWAETRTEYSQLLGQMDVVVSTADHEFFGIAVCEAIASGAAPVLPDRLSYRELIPNNRRYESVEQAAKMIADYCDLAKRKEAVATAQSSIANFRIENTVKKLDDAICELSGS